MLCTRPEVAVQVADFCRAHLHPNAFARANKHHIPTCTLLDCQFPAAANSGAQPDGDRRSDAGSGAQKNMEKPASQASRAIEKGLLFFTRLP